MKYFCCIFFGSLLFSATHAFAQDTLYDSQNPKLPCTFQFPRTWSISESDGTTEPYSEYDLLGRANKQKTFSTHISVSITDAAVAKATNLNDYLDRFTERAKQLYDRYEVVRRIKTQVWGQSVPTLDIAYALPLPIEQTTNTWTIILERRAVILNNGKLWTFIYSADANDYEASLPVFQHFLDTFFFK